MGVYVQSTPTDIILDHTLMHKLHLQYYHLPFGGITKWTILDVIDAPSVVLPIMRNSYFPVAKPVKITGLTPMELINKINDGINLITG